VLHRRHQLRPIFRRSDRGSGTVQDFFDLIRGDTGMILAILLDEVTALVVLGKGHGTTVLRGISFLVGHALSKQGPRRRLAFCL